MTYTYFKAAGIFFLFSVLLSAGSLAKAQDTLRVSLSEFIEKGMEFSGQVAYERAAAELAHNRVGQAKAQRILPSISLNSQHGIIPGVISRDPTLSAGEYYLDPNLENDWEDWAIFTRAELNAVQPIFAWGAIQSAINAATAGAKAAEYQFEAVENEAGFRYYELYYSYLLAIEVRRILDDAYRQLDRVERTLHEMRDEGNPDLKESDIFKFEILKTEFETQIVEVNESFNFVQRVWNYALQAPEGIAYMPEENFLDPIPYELEPYDFYSQMAFNNRAELKGVHAGIDALASGLQAVKAQQYPMLFFGITGSFAHTPNRPRQTNPFIRNTTNYLSGAVGFGIRQNLNFQSLRNNVNRAEIEYKRVNDLQKAVSDGITLELNEAYRDAVIADTKVKQTQEALSIARNWLRNEQLNYDLEIGDAEDLLEALQQELELRVELKQNIFDLNKKVATLYKASGVPVTQINVNE